MLSTDGGAGLPVDLTPGGNECERKIPVKWRPLQSPAMSYDLNFWRYRASVDGDLQTRTDADHQRVYEHLCDGSEAVTSQLEELPLSAVTERLTAALGKEWVELDGTGEGFWEPRSGREATDASRPSSRRPRTG